MAGCGRMTVASLSNDFAAHWVFAFVWSPAVQCLSLGALPWFAGLVLTLLIGLPAFLSAAVTVPSSRSGGATAIVNINQASIEDLRSIRGIGPARARRIVEERARGPFRDLDDLSARVPGIGPTTATRLARNGLRVQPDPAGRMSDNPKPHSQSPSRTATPATP